jgi:hypothetical protein
MITGLQSLRSKNVKLESIMRSYAQIQYLNALVKHLFTDAFDTYTPNDAEPDPMTYHCGVVKRSSSGYATMLIMEI